MMKMTTTIWLLGLGLLVSACTGTDISTRNTPFEQVPDTDVATPQGYASTQPDTKPNPATNTVIAKVPGQSLVSVNSITVQVPQSLTVSEANSYLPRQDIVWRGDPIGNRRAQVQKIVQGAMNKGVAQLNGPVKVNVEITVTRFHALTEKARYSVGGVHSIWFDMAIKDPKTGALLVPVRSVRADLDAFGGSRALRAEARGQTQKVRISDHLAEVIRQELSNPKGYSQATLGFYQLLNNI